MNATSLHAAAGAALSAANCLGACNFDRPLKGMQGVELARCTNRDARSGNIRAGLVEEIIKISKAGGSMVMNGASISEPMRMISDRLPFFPSIGKLEVFKDTVGMEEPVMFDSFVEGRLVENRQLYRQTFFVRSYEVGEDKTAPIETIMNYFQETSLGHVKLLGIAGDGFGTTKAMVQVGLIWVVSRIHVEIDRYPVWGEVIELDTWVASSGKNGLRRDWLIRNVKTGQVLARATSTWAMIHQQTRRLSKMPDAAREEIYPQFIERQVMVKEKSLKINKLNDESAVFKTTNLQARRTDLDMNHHVNNVKYIDWMMESVPARCLETQEIRCLTLEYRQECGQADLVDSLTSPESVQTLVSAGSQPGTCETKTDPEFSYLSGFKASRTLQRNLEPEQQFTHLLKLQANGAELVRGRSMWRPKSPTSHSLANFTPLTPTQSGLCGSNSISTLDKSRKIFPST